MTGSSYVWGDWKHLSKLINPLFIFFLFLSMEQPYFILIRVSIRIAIILSIIIIIIIFILQLMCPLKFTKAGNCDNGGRFCRDDIWDKLVFLLIIWCCSCLVFSFYFQCFPLFILYTYNELFILAQLKPTTSLE